MIWDVKLLCEGGISDSTVGGGTAEGGIAAFRLAAASD